MYTFEKLHVYQEAMDLLEDVHAIVKTLPKSESRILASQMKRSSIFVVLSITEGAEGHSDRELKVAFENAQQFIHEIIVHLKMIERLYKTHVGHVLERCDSVNKKLDTLIKIINEEKRVKRHQHKHQAELAKDE